MVDILRRIKKIFLPAALVVFSFPCFSSADEAAPKKVSLIPLWKPQAQFAGYYVALEKGIYKNHGLDVTILEGGPDSPPALMLEQGKADFGVLWLSSAIRARSAGNRLVNICQVSQRSGLMLVAKKSSGIRTPADFQGKSASIWEGDLELQPRAFFRKYGLDVRTVPQAYTINLFLKDGVHLASMMWYNEYDTIINSGFDPEDLTTFLFSDYGLNFPEDGIYCREETLKNEPAVAAAFAQASLDGWRYAFAHQEEAVDIVLARMREANLPANRVHQRWMLERMKDLVAPADKARVMGALNAADYETVSAELVAAGLIPAAVRFEELRPSGERP